MSAKKRGMNSVLKAADSRTVRRQAGGHFYYVKHAVTLMLLSSYCDFVEKIDLVQVSLKVASKLYYLLFNILENSFENLKILDTYHF